MTTTTTATAPAAIKRYTAADLTEEMRQRAATDEWQALVIEGQAPVLRRRAAQAVYEADLWNSAYDAEETMDAELARRPGLAAVVEGADAAEKAALEQLDAAAADETVAVGEWERAADPKQKRYLAIGKAQAAETTAEARQHHDDAQRALIAARDALAAHQREAERLQTAYDKAGREAESPGQAPMTDAEKTIRIHARPAEMSELEKDWLRTAYGELIGVHDRPASARPAPRSQETSGLGWQRDVALMDPGKARVIRQGTHTHIIPASRPA